MTTSYLNGLGYTVRDVGTVQSFDLEALRGSQSLKVEVKGTTSVGEEIILTANEVDVHLKSYPHNALAIVHSRALDRSVEPPVAGGGVLEYRQPWSVVETDLTPMAFRYRTGL